MSISKILDVVRRKGYMRSSGAGEPLMVQRNSDGKVGTEGRGIVLQANRKLEIAAAQSRYRKGIPSSEGSVLVDVANLDINYPTSGRVSPTSTAYKVANGVAGTRTLLTLPDGRKRWALKMTCPFTSGNESGWEIALATPITLSVSDTIEFEFYAPAGSVSRIYLGGSDLTGGAYLIWRSVNHIGVMSYVRRTGTCRVSIPVAQLASAGGFTIASQIRKIRVAITNTGANGQDCYLTNKIYTNRKERTQLLITTDDGLPSSVQLAQECLSRGLKMTAYIIPGLIDQSGYMTSAQLAQLAAYPNVQIANHSYSHQYVNGGSVGAVFGSSVNSVCLSQTLAAGALMLNGSTGAGAFDRPRHLTFQTSANAFGVYVDVVGSLNGVSQTERVYLGTGTAGYPYPYPSQLVYDSVTSLTVGANAGITPTGNINVGYSCSYDEMYTDAKLGFEYNESRGYSDPYERHYCCPQGQWSNLLMQALADLGVKTCRFTDQTPVSITGEFDAYQIPSLQIQEAVDAANGNTAVVNCGLYADWCVAAGTSAWFYAHQITWDDATPAVGGTKGTSMKTFLDKVAGYVASGAADCPTVSGFYATTYPAY